MKLLAKSEANSKIKKANEQDLETSIRLRKLIRDTQTALANLKASYDPDKIAKKADYDTFCRDIQENKGKQLKELAEIERLVEEKKDIYFGFVQKQDALEERIYNATEREKKLDLRQNLLTELERKWTTKTTG